MRALPPADPFPIDALGDVLGAAARLPDSRSRSSAPRNGAQSVLAFATLAVQATRLMSCCDLAKASPSRF